MTLRASTTTTLVAAVARNGVIGVEGRLPWHLAGDLPRVKALTMGHVLVVGRVTYDSIGRPLPGRTTVVVTRQACWRPANEHTGAVLVAASADDALARAAEVDDEIFVLGGAQIYAATLPSADVLDITWVDAEPHGDTYFPPVDWSQWSEVSRSAHDGWALARYRRRTASSKKV